MNEESHKSGTAAPVKPGSVASALCGELDYADADGATGLIWLAQDAPLADITCGQCRVIATIKAETAVL